MKTEEQFYTSYPLVFPEGEPYCGFNCGDGWYTLLDTLFFAITKDLKKVYSKIKLDPQDKFSIAQIKEKFGGLRIYYNNGTDYIDDIINQAENMSEHICETCGEYGSIRNSSYWIKVRCDKCEEEYINNRDVKLSIESKKLLDEAIEGAKNHPPIYLESFAKYADDDAEPEWINPNFQDEIAEFKHLISQEYVGSLDDVLAAAGTGQLIDLDNTRWKDIYNSYSSDEHLTMEEALLRASESGRDIDKIFQAINNGSLLYAPVVVELPDGRWRLISGNTRLMACRVMGINPKVWFFSLLESPQA
jgi:hypothetical protein